MKIVVTGGAGFIGSHLCRALLSDGGCKVVVLDSLRTGSRSRLETLLGAGLRLIEGTVTDPETVADALSGAAVVYHLAAMVSVPESMRHPTECVAINVGGTLNVLGAAAEAGVKKVILASSAAIYGEHPADPKSEALAPDPRSPYAITKLDGEYYGSMYAREQGLGFAALRFFNVFGPGQDPNSTYAAAVPIFIRRALAGQPLLIHGDGEQTRDFIYVADIVSALRFAAGNESVRGVYNVGYGERTSIKQLAARICSATGSASEIRHGSPRLGDVRHSCADAGKLRMAGWTPKFGMASGLDATVQALRASAG